MKSFPADLALLFFVGFEHCVCVNGIPQCLNFHCQLKVQSRPRADVQIENLYGNNKRLNMQIKQFYTLCT